MTDQQSLRVLPSADVDPRASLGAGTTVWHLAQVREHAVVGDGCVIGRGAYIDAGVRVGDRSKIQNYALVYAPARLGEGVFVGPAAVLTNDTYPRSVDPDGERKIAGDWEARGVLVGDGASIGAQAVVLAGVTIGRWALVGAAAVVTRDVPDHGLVVGSPARRVGWVGPAGAPLQHAGAGRWTCPREGRTYEERDGALVEL